MARKPKHDEPGPLRVRVSLVDQMVYFLRSRGAQVVVLALVANTMVAQLLYNSAGQLVLDNRFLLGYLIEETIGPVNSEDVSLLGLVRLLRRNLPTLEHTIETWDHHLHELEQPEGMARLQAALDEEAARHRQDPDDTDEDDEQNEDADRGTGKRKRTLSPIQVLANQRIERQRVQSLYEAIQAGLHQLEDEFSDLRAARP